MSDTIIDLAMASVAFVFLALGFFYAGRWVGQREVEQQAVKHKAAAWMVDDKGGTRLEWRVRL